ncbi:MAG: hypothetical protein K2X32_13880 [Phycisphaerales bacterium]|nr:hypothetical protein [Phycisphaerales bacterium]
MNRKVIALLCCTAVALALAAGAYFALGYEPGADTSYDTRVAAPALADRRPRVLFDHGHNNIHSAAGRYKPFVSLISADGCRVASGSGSFTASALAAADILVVVNAQGGKDNRAGPAFSQAECDAVRDWVRAGGALLLVADHHPCGEAAAALASRFSVEMSGGWTDDEANARPKSGDPGQLLFTRENGGLSEHPITAGRSPSESVNVVETFTGQSLKGPLTPDAAALLRLADSAMDRIPVGSETKAEGSQVTTTFKTRDASAAGRCQGLSMRFGKGRVVVLAEAAMLTAQIDNKSGQPFGMNAPNNDNRQFALNVVRWLAGGLGD